jgi:Pyridine nucleotide-disulphide oxidoreductase, dimerisation domain
VLRTEATDETQGFMKVLVGASDDRILGFTMIGSEAGEVMAAVADGDACDPAISGASRRRSGAPDDGGGAWPAVLECAAPAAAARRPCSVIGAPP